MKKISLSLFTALFMLCAAIPAFAAVGIYEGGVPKGSATDLDFPSSIGDQLTNNGSKWTFNLLHGGVGKSGATTMTTAQLAVPVAYGYVKKAIEPTDAAFQTGTLGDGVPGQLLTIHITECTGGSWVLSITTSAQLETVTFDAVGEVLSLIWMDDTNGWCLFGYSNATVTFNDNVD